MEGEEGKTDGEVNGVSPSRNGWTGTMVLILSHIGGADHADQLAIVELKNYTDYDCF